MIVVTAMLVAAQTLGFQIGGLLALGGVGGLAVGLAAKDLLANAHAKVAGGTDTGAAVTHGVMHTIVLA